MANRIVTTDEISSVANAIRAKIGSSGAMKWPLGFVNTIAGITEKAAATYYPSSSDQTIAKDQLLKGAQTIKGVTTEGIVASNIKYGVVAKVGDADDDDRILRVFGTLQKKIDIVTIELKANIAVQYDDERWERTYTVKEGTIPASYDNELMAEIEIMYPAVKKVELYDKGSGPLSTYGFTVTYEGIDNHTYSSVPDGATIAVIKMYFLKF